MCPLSHIRVPQSTYHFVQSWLVRPFRKAGPALTECTWDIMPEDRSTIERIARIGPVDPVRVLVYSFVKWWKHS